MLNQDADNHILEFVRSKFGTVDKSCFETQLYLCLSAFQPQEWEFYRVLSTDTLVLPFYALIVVQKTICIALTAFRKWSVHPKTNLEATTSVSIKSKDMKTVEGVIPKESGSSDLHFRKNVQSSGESSKTNPRDKNTLEDKNEGSEKHSTKSLDYFQTKFQSFLDYIESSKMLRFVTHMDERPMQSFHVCKFSYYHR